MPVVGFKCPVERTNVPFDHFESCTARNGRAAFPPWLARMIAIKETEEKDPRHQTTQPTASRVTSCPREVFLSVHFDYYVNPEHRAVMDRGTALHETAEKYTDPTKWMTEVTLEGELFGVKVTARADAIRKDMGEIVDYKFPKDWSVAFRQKMGGKAKDEHAVQLNVIRLLLEQQEWAKEAGYDPNGVLLTIWDHGIGKIEGPEPMDAVHMTEEEILAIRPGGSEYTVKEIVGTIVWMEGKEAELSFDPPTPYTKEKQERLAATLPLVGETMFNGQKCPQYCELSSICEGLVRKYGRPDEIVDADHFIETGQVEA